MSAESAIQNLALFLNDVKQQIYSSFAQSDGGCDSRLALIELSRAADTFFVRPLLTRQPNDPLLSNLYSKGIPTCLTSFMDECANRSGAPLARSTQPLQNWSHSCLQTAGRIAHVEHLLEIVKEGSLAIRQLAPNRYEISPAKAIIDLEAFDVADQEWMQTQTVQDDKRWTDHLANQLPNILERMRRIVYPFREHFIGYGAEPEIDDHYQSAGIAWGRSLTGQTELDGDSLIGGHPFYAYRAAIAIMCGRALKHLSFAGELLLMRQKMEHHNLFTMWSARHIWVEFLADSLDTSFGTATDLLNAITLDPDYRNAFGRVPCAPMPPLVQVGSNDLMMSLRGCLDAPFWFLSRKLRHCFRSDWDRIIDRREVMFREELSELFKLPAIHAANYPVRIRTGKQDVTDVDAVLFDATDGTLLLFQLKWQDPFGHSMRERRSKMKNMISTANQWAVVVREWTERTSKTDLTAALHLGEEAMKHSIERVELIILARHHARFSGAEPITKDAAWGTWPQLCRIAAQRLKRPHVFRALIDILREEEGRIDSPRQLWTGTIDINEIQVSIVGDEKREM